MTELQQRILEISKKKGLSHLSSCLTSVDIIDAIYANKQEDDIFILSNGHAGLALYVVLEKYYGFDAEKLYDKHGTHPNKCQEDKIHCSTGSLGCGLAIAVGHALADRTVHCLISDGECAEGIVWESLAFIRNKNLKNINVYVNMNGFSAYDVVDKEYLCSRLRIFLPEINIHLTDLNDFPFLENSLKSHYCKL